MEMQWGEISGPTNADDISITFGSVEICVRDSNWLKSLIAALQYQQPLSRSRDSKSDKCNHIWSM